MNEQHIIIIFIVLTEAQYAFSDKFHITEVGRRINEIMFLD